MNYKTNKGEKEMKGILIENYIFKNVEVKKGTEVGVLNGYCTCDSYEYMIELQDGRQIPVDAKYIEITDYRPFVSIREKKFEVALAIMQGMYANGNNYDSPSEIAQKAITQAEIFIDKIKDKL